MTIDDMNKPYRLICLNCIYIQYKAEQFSHFHGYILNTECWLLLEIFDNAKLSFTIISEFSE